VFKTFFSSALQKGAVYWSLIFVDFFDKPLCAYVMKLFSS
jgi:hypothetical protein